MGYSKINSLTVWRGEPALAAGNIDSIQEAAFGSHCSNLDAGVSDKDIVLRSPKLRPSAFYPERTREGQLHLVLILKLDT